MVTFTRVEYMYRDADNYKAWAHVDLAGAITPEQRETVRLTLASINVDHDGFIPEKIDWPHAGLSLDKYPDPESDHDWHELDVDNGITVIEQADGPTPTQTVEEWVGAMTSAIWDPLAYYGIEH